MSNAGTNGESYAPTGAGVQSSNLLDPALTNNLNAPVAEELEATPDTFTNGGVPLDKTDYAAAANDHRGVRDEIRYPRLSKPVTMLRYDYDCVVVGSGYGGGIAASRMARAGKTVCVLELGKERWPGEFPVSLAQSAPEVHTSGEFGGDESRVLDVTVGNPTGLYHLISGEGQDIFVANGLGGTSLLNANVFLRTDKRTLQLHSWPPEIRSNPDCLDKYYERAASVLQPTAYPEGFPTLKKLSVLQKQAELLGMKNQFYRVPQTTRFVDGLNSTGVEMKASKLLGQDCTGVNDNSKSSTLPTYIADAWNWGAEIFTECEVRYVAKEPNGPGWIIFFAWHGDKRAAFKDNFYQDLMFVKAKELCFLGAGTVGTTEILLRSRANGLKMSDNIGYEMSGNGDILAFGYNTNYSVNGMGSGNPIPDRPVGPTITGVIDTRETAPDVLDGYVLEEGAAPQALTSVLQAMLEVMPGKDFPEPYGLVERARHMFSRHQSRLLGPYVPGGSLNRTQIYLIMSHDNNQATLTLEDNDKVYLRFLGVARSKHVQELNEILAKATSLVGGTLIHNPFYALRGKEVSVHPIGGACLSYDGTGKGGVTNHMGEIFKGEGSETHQGLVCVDGSVIPCALGVNPFATISAFAERSVEAVAEKYKAKIDYMTPNGRLDLFGKPKVIHPLDAEMAKAQRAISAAVGSNGVRFTEIMEGWMAIGNEIENYEVAEKKAKGSASAARFYLSVDTYSTKNLITENKASMATGTFSCGALSRDPFMVLRGEVQFFSQDLNTPDTKNLLYKLVLRGTDGRILHFEGFKVVDGNMAFSARQTWKATTTLFTTLREPDGRLVGRGKLIISWRNFASELLSFGGLGSGIIGRVKGAAGFVSFFASQAAGYFFYPFSMLQYPSLSTTGYYPKKQQPNRVETLTASDGVKSLMYVWAPQGRPSNRTPLLLVPGASVDHQIFALPTIPVNTVDYFLAEGYTIYCVVHRVGKLKVAEKGYTTYDARLDVKAAVDYVHRENPNPMYCIVHCAGSQAMAMALLDGTISPSLLRGLTASNVFASPKFAGFNQVKARLPISLTTVYRALAGEWFSCLSSQNDRIVQKLMDQILRFYPAGGKDELCTSTACHRSELAFGRLWSHKQLNSSTHANIANFLGGVSMNALDHLLKMGTNDAVMDNEYKSLITGSNISRLRGLPILFVHGADNAVYTPESTDIDYNMLRETGFGSELYQRTVFPGKGHLDLWMGKTSFREGDVYPRVSEHIKWVLARQSQSKEDGPRLKNGPPAPRQ